MDIPKDLIVTDVRVEKLSLDDANTRFDKVLTTLKRDPSYQELFVGYEHRIGLELANQNREKARLCSVLASQARAQHDYQAYTYDFEGALDSQQIAHTLEMMVAKFTIQADAFDGTQ